MLITTSTPSTLEARMLASDKPSNGGASKIMTSAPLFARVTWKLSMARESSRSGGFGGSGPAGIAFKLGILTAWVYDLREKSPTGKGVLCFHIDPAAAERGGAQATIALLRPSLSLGRCNRSAMVGRRMSASMSNVFLPAFAI